MGSDRALPRGLGWALAAGLALRAWYFVDLVRQPWYGHPLVDSLTYHRTALGMLEQGHPGAFFRPPLYPWLLAAVYRVFGTAPGPVVWLQFLLGLGALWPAYRLGERWFGRRAALAGAWIAALYPLRIFFEGELLDVTVFAFLLLWGLWLVWEGSEAGDAPRLLLAGLLLGVATLTRPNVLIALPFVAAGAWLVFRRAGRLVPAHGAAWALGVVLGILPATVHNWRAEGAFIPVAANGGVNFYLGNEPGATGLTPVPPGLRWEAVMQEPVREGRHTLAAQEAYWYRRARTAILADPARWARLLGAKAALFANAAESSNNKALGHFTAVSFPVRHYRWWFGSLLCLAAVGCLSLRGRGAAFLALVAAGFAVSVVLFFVTERYRLPLVPLLAPAAAAGALEVARAVRAGESRHAAVLLLGLAVCALGVFPDWFGAGRERISADFQMGQVFLMRREPERALEHLRRARAADPGDPDVFNSLGAAFFQKGDLAAAADAYRAALGLGEFSEVWFNLGVVAERAGRAGEAAEAYRRALAVNPLEHRARANLEALLGETDAGGRAGS